jgi:hypothetical protein
MPLDLSRKIASLLINNIHREFVFFLLFCGASIEWLGASFSGPDCGRLL